MKLAKYIDIKIWVISLVSLVLTAACGRIPSTSDLKLGFWLLLLIFMGVAAYVGYALKKSHWVNLFIFPVCYMIGAYFFAPQYSWYYAPIYLLVSYLAWSMSRTKPEEVK